ncbi:MAG TPA: DNA gyrase modulator, partial [Woeseiaceae bacterium]|nr:DNA gyrase modulator [Woeseiaceae bacterium]
MKNGRREFLRRLAAGGTVVSMPFFAAACGSIPAATFETETPDNPFLSWFGIDNATIARVMAALTANGADTAELYFQHRRSSELALAHGAISSSAAHIDQGVGVRVVIDGQVGFACTEELTLPSMLAAARSAAAIASGARVMPPQ